MKKAKVFWGVVASLFLCTTLANAGTNYYLAANIGAALLNDSDIMDSSVPFVTFTAESETGMGASLAMGYNFGNARVEGEIAYQKNDLDSLSLNVIGYDLGDASISGDTSSIAFLVNGYYDIHNKTSVTPYIGGGLGMANVDLGAVYLDNYGQLTRSVDDTVFAYHLTAGVAFPVTDSVSLDLKYRYFATADLEIDTGEVEYSSHNFYAGVRVDF